jgi:hypothetical protein
MLRRSDVLPEVPMFSLIALYFEYRKMQAPRTLTVTAATQRIRASNDVGSNRTVATAA